MEALKLVQEQKSNITDISKRPEAVNDYSQLSELELINLFPLPRYFQIHFQHLHDNIETLKADTQSLKRSVLEMNTKLDLLLQHVSSELNN